PAAGDAGGGISSISPLITMTDNILWGNKANAIVDDLNTSFIQSNIIQFNMFEETGTGVNAVANNIPNDEGVNPLFAEGWYLGLSSPAFDTGSTASFPAYITELGTPIADAAGIIDTGTLDKGVHYTIAPIIANANTSSVTPASQATTISTQVTIDITPKDASGLLLGAGQNVAISGAIYGTVSSVTDLGNGSYLVTFTASALTAEADTLTVNVNGVSLTTQPYISW
ncbi:MAG: Ig-like domain-containing protein, partial [Gammaproteobacteria bacterium]|nr:Ig-like domain-containing protein [Gammaproteobacteria bacterium]